MARTRRAPRDALGGRILYAEPKARFSKRRFRDLFLVTTVSWLLVVAVIMGIVATKINRTPWFPIYILLLLPPPLAYWGAVMLRLVNLEPLVISTAGLRWRRLEIGPTAWEEIEQVEVLDGKHAAYRFVSATGASYVHAKGPFGVRHEVEEQTIEKALGEAGFVVRPVPTARAGKRKNPPKSAPGDNSEE